MGTVTSLADKRKSHPQEEATQDNTLPLSIPQSNENETYIFSPKVDRFIDRSIPLVIIFVISYFTGHMFRYFLLR